MIAENYLPWKDDEKNDGAIPCRLCDCPTWHTEVGMCWSCQSLVNKLKEDK